MAKIKNMGTSTMRFGEGVIISGSAGTDNKSLIVTGSMVLSGSESKPAVDIYANVSGQYVTIIDNDQSSQGHVLKLLTDGNGSGSRLLEMEDGDGDVIFRARADGRFGFGPDGVDSMGAGTFVVGIDNSSHTSDIAISQRLQHLGDGNTYMEFPSNDNITFAAGGSEELKIASDAALVKEYIKHIGDEDTYIQFTDDMIQFAAGGRTFIKLEEASTDKVIINHGTLDIDLKVGGLNQANLIRTDAANDRVGIGTSSPISILDVAGKIAITSEVSTPSAPADGKGWLYTKTDGKIYWQSADIAETDLTSGGGGSTNAEGSDGQIQYNNGGTSFGGASQLYYDDSNHRLGIGISSPDQSLHIQDGNLILQHNANNAFANEMIFAKSRHATDGSHTVVQGGDVLGEIVFKGSDGDEFVGAAAIKVVADNTRTTAAGSESAPGNNDMPGRIEFWTTKDGVANSTRQVTIDRLGNVFLLEGGLYVSGSGTGHGPLESSYAGAPYGGGLIDWSWGGATDVYRMRNVSTGPADGERGQWGILQRAKTTSTHADLNTLVLDQSGNMILGATTIHSYSDKRRKENIRDLESVISNVMNLRPVKFSWKDRWKNETRSNDVMGFIAQEVKPLFPETVMEADFEEEIPGDELYLSYVELIPVLTKAIQEQQEKIESLEARIDALESS